MIPFTKMHGAGNDYVYIDCFANPIPKTTDIPTLARKMSDRHFGIGGDGLILICPSQKADAEMRMYNNDGSYSEMCGNGIRCVAKYLYDHGICKKETLNILSGGQILTIQLTLTERRVSQARVDMGEPILTPAEIPTTLRADDPTAPIVALDLTVAHPAGEKTLAVTSVSMGNPHCVTFVEKLTDDWTLVVGPLVERAAEFPNGTNAEFVEVISRTEVKQRTFERGTGETLACGTGASAVCVAGVLTGKTERKIKVHLPGGTLLIEWDEKTNHVYMTGPASEVYQGNWPLKNELS